MGERCYHLRRANTHDQPYQLSTQIHAYSPLRLKVARAAPDSCVSDTFFVELLHHESHGNVKAYN